VSGILRRIGGIVVLFLGTTVLLWIAYNLFVERLPVTRGMNPLPALGFVAACFYVGLRWIRGQVAK
jgi:hypothetical protein